MKKPKLSTLKKLLALIILLGLFFLASPLLIIKFSGARIYYDTAEIQADAEVAPAATFQVAIAFGASVKPDGQPSDMLADRLTAAAELYHAGIVEKILVSGDNSDPYYNEPDAMAAYLTASLGVPSSAIAIDYAGNRTYDTCARAHEIWDLTEAILVTQEYHLYRAMFTCKALGVDNIGYSATLQPYVFDDYYRLREIAALYKAVMDVYFFPPKYIGGEAEEL